MKPAHLIVVAALVGVGALLYLAFDTGSGRGGQRGEGAKREAARVSGSDHEAQPEGTAGVFIQVHPAGVAQVILTGPRNWRGRTSEDGSAFAGWMTPGRYAVSAHQGELTAAKTFAVEERTTVELHLDESIAVRGHVFDAAGRAIAGAVVQAMPESERTAVHPGWRVSWLAANARPPIYAEATTDQKGAYALRVRAAAYTLEARAAGFAGMNEPARSYDSATDGVDFHLQPGARVAGRVVDSAGQPVPDALVVVRGGPSVNTLAYSDADGSFYLDVPVSGWSHLAVRAHAYAPTMFGSIHPPVAGLV
ncbi:MAG: carboxypeptidase-like regulatory domain-containing protein, partial [Planctomycetota bacterium]